MIDHEDIRLMDTGVFRYGEDTQGRMRVFDDKGTPFTHEEAYRIAEVLWRYMDETDGNEMQELNHASLEARMRSLAYFASFRQDAEPQRSVVDKKEGFVYLMKSGGLFKIGKTHDVNVRLQSLRNGSGATIDLIHAIATNDRHVAEKFWHGRFIQQRRHGEWFDLSERDIAEFRAHRPDQEDQQ